MVGSSWFLVRRILWFFSTNYELPTTNFSKPEPSLDMRRQPMAVARGLHHRFRKGGMRMDGFHHLFIGGFELHGQSQFRQQFGGFGTQDVGPEQLPVFCAEDQLDQAFGMPDGAGLAAGGEGE